MYSLARNALLLPPLTLAAAPSSAGDLAAAGTYGEDFVSAPGDELTVGNLSAPGVRIQTLHFELTDGVVFDPEQTGGFPGEVVDLLGDSGFDGNFVYGEPFFQPLPEPRTVYGTLTLTFADFDPGESITVLLDVDQDDGVEAFVPGSDFVGSTLHVTFGNGWVSQVESGAYTLSGADAAVAVAGSLSATPVETVRLGTPPNPAALTLGQTSGPVVGSTWDPAIEHATFLPGATLDVALVSLAPANVPIPPNGTLLCDPAAPVFLFLAPPGDAFDIVVPDLCGLIGLELCAQGISSDGVAILFTNALDATIGT